ncbi:MAG TPA: hypothetical protein K8V21_04365 [Weissella thailandensis]|nr:hypothetical protein [Weissella thailandensis]HJG84602.1 hypothetical protein [Weissella thailandensis]
MDHQIEIQHPWLALMGPIIGAFVGMLSETSLNIALPQLSQSLNIDNAALQWIVTGYMLVIGIILPLSSLLTKWFTPRQIITTGIGALSFNDRFPLAISPSQTHALNSLEIYESADESTIINTLQQIVGAIATATSLLQMGISASHGASSAVAFTHGVHNRIIFTIVLAVIGLLIALSINNKNELRH